MANLAIREVAKINSFSLSPLYIRKHSNFGIFAKLRAEYAIKLNKGNRNELRIFNS